MFGSEILNKVDYLHLYYGTSGDVAKLCRGFLHVLQLSQKTL